MFIQTEDTPNPATLKFLPGRDVAGPGATPIEFTRGADVSNAPLAEMLFMIPDVTRLMFGSDFISVTKSEESQWKHLRPAVLGAIMDFFVAGGVPLSEQLQAGDLKSLPYDFSGSVLGDGGRAYRFQRDGHIYTVPGRPGQFR